MNTDSPALATGNAPKSAVPLRRILVVLIVGMALYFGYAMWQGLEKLRAGLEHFHWIAFAAACALAFGNYVLRFFKWEFYLARLEIRGVNKLDSFLIFLSGFVLTVSPGKVGEVFKSVVLEETYGVPAPKTAPIVVAERVTDLIGVIVLILIGSVGFSGGIVPVAIGGALVIALLAVISSRKLSMGLIALTRRLPGRLGTFGPKLEVAYGSLSVLVTFRNLVAPTLMSIGAWSLECMALWVILWGFGEPVSAPLATFFYATSTLMGAVIPVPGGLGVTEAALRSQMIEIGKVSPDVSTDAMYLVRFATLWFAVLVGFGALAALKRRHPNLLKGN
jgi:uncharacterized protein (TIRG00374 family)